MTKLTETQAKALEFIRDSIERSGVAPTLREICGFMGYKAVGSAQDLVSALRRKGFIEENERQAARTYHLTSLARNQSRTEDYDANTFVIPCLGFVPAGNPVEAIDEHIGTMRMSIAAFAKPAPRADQLFAVRAKGESMIGAGIFDGDWLVVKLDQEPPKESIVVARVDGDVTVKRLAKDKTEGWFLKPENPAFSPMFAKDHEFEIVGQVLALQRSLT